MWSIKFENINECDLMESIISKNESRVAGWSGGLPEGVTLECDIHLMDVCVFDILEGGTLQQGFTIWDDVLEMDVEHERTMKYLIQCTRSYLATQTRRLNCLKQKWLDYGGTLMVEDYLKCGKLTTKQKSARALLEKLKSARLNY